MRLFLYLAILASFLAVSRSTETAEDDAASEIEVSEIEVSADVNISLLTKLLGKKGKKTIPKVAASTSAAKNTKTEGTCTDTPASTAQDTTIETTTTDMPTTTAQDTSPETTSTTTKAPWKKPKPTKKPPIVTKKVKTTTPETITTEMPTKTADNTTTEMSTTESTECPGKDTVNQLIGALLEFAKKFCVEAYRKIDRGSSFVCSPWAALRCFCIIAIYSPYSRQYDHSMKLLGLKNADQARCACDVLNKKQNTLDENTMTSNVFTSPDYKMTPDYLKLIEKYLNGVGMTINFNKSVQATNQMNNVMKKTSGKTQPPIEAVFTDPDDINSETRQVIGTIACINLTPKYAFNIQTVPIQYRISSSKYRTMESKTQKIICQYAELKKLKAAAVKIMLPKKNELWVIRPKHESGVTSLMSHVLDGETLTMIRNTMTDTIVNLYMPANISISIKFDVKKIIMSTQSVDSLFKSNRAKYVNAFEDDKSPAISVMAQTSCLTINYDGEEPVPTIQGILVSSLQTENFIVDQPSLALVIEPPLNIVAVAVI